MPTRKWKTSHLVRVSGDGKTLANRITRRSYLRRKPPLLKGGAVIHLDSPDEAAPMGNENLEIQPKRLHSWAGHGYRARFGVKVPFTVSACCVLPPGGNLATAGEDGTACIWNAKDAKKLYEIKAHEGGVLCIVSFPNGKCFLTGGCDGRAKIWKFLSAKPTLFACLNHGFAVVGAVVYPDARQLLTLGLDGVAKVWRVENEEFLCQGGAGLSALGISRFGGNIFTASSEGSIERFSDDGKQLSVWDGHVGPINAIIVFPDESRVLTAGEDGQAIVWQMSGNRHKKLGPFDSPVLCADVSACCQWILIGCKDGAARLFNAKSGNMLCSWQLGQKASRAISPNATLEEAEKGQLETHRIQACCFIPVESCFLLAGAFGMQVWHFPVVETID